VPTFSGGLEKHDDFIDLPSWPNSLLTRMIAAERT